MKFVFRISTRLRSMAPIPRDFLPISGLEHLGLVFNQAIITTPAEFNAAQTQLSDPRFPRRGCQFYAYALTAEDEAKLEPAESAAAAEFILDGKAILIGETRVAGLFGDDKQLRVLSEHAELRPAIEAWLESLTPSEP